MSGFRWQEDAEGLELGLMMTRGSFKRWEFLQHTDLHVKHWEILSLQLVTKHTAIYYTYPHFRIFYEMFFAILRLSGQTSRHYL